MTSEQLSMPTCSIEELRRKALQSRKRKLDLNNANEASYKADKADKADAASYKEEDIEDNENEIGNGNEIGNREEGGQVTMDAMKDAREEGELSETEYTLDLSHRQKQQPRYLNYF